MLKFEKPELLAPAGDIEKLKVAVAYGADAVYIGGQSLGLRAKSKNFNLGEMEQGISFAHSYGKKVYVTANIFAHNDDFEGMAEYFVKLEQIGADALIISDIGVFSVAKEVVPKMEIHISTQANTTNYQSCLAWEKLGASRVVLARELSLNEIGVIYNKVGRNFALEAFVHGAMCISYSGRCLLSNYMTSRDSNRGACAQPCRWKYYVVEETRPDEYMPIMEDERGTYIYNSKDLCMIRYIPDLLRVGVSSFKIEGRMKTPYYVGTLVKAYREAIDDYFENPETYESRKMYYYEQVQKASHRKYTTGFYFDKTDSGAQIYEHNSYVRKYDFVGIVLDYDSESSIATIEQRNKFVKNDEVEFLRACKNDFSQIVSEIKNLDGKEQLDAPHPKQILKIKVDQPVCPMDMIRKKSKDDSADE